VTGVVLTLLVLLINASVRSRSVAPLRQLAAQTWIDRILPIIAASSQQGQAVDRIWTDGLKLPATSISTQLDQTVAGAAAAYHEVVALQPPASLAGPSGLLEACLLARSQATVVLRDALTQDLGSAGAGGSSDPNIGAIQTAGQDLQVADRAYQLFTGSLPKVGVTMPASVWVTDASAYQPASLQLFLTSLHNATSLTPLHQLKIYAVTTSPSPVSLQGAVEELPPSRAISVSVVVADTGNQPERNLTVTASISPSLGTASVRAFVDLAPGQARTMANMGPLNPPQGPLVTLAVTITARAGSSTPPATQTLTLQMPAPTPASSVPAPGKPVAG